MHPCQRRPRRSMQTRCHRIRPLTSGRRPTDARPWRFSSHRHPRMQSRTARSCLVDWLSFRRVGGPRRRRRRKRWRRVVAAALNLPSRSLCQSGLPAHALKTCRHRIHPPTQGLAHCRSGCPRAIRQHPFTTNLRRLRPRGRKSLREISLPHQLMVGGTRKAGWHTRAQRPRECRLESGCSCKG